MCYYALLYTTIHNVYTTYDTNYVVLRDWLCSLLYIFSIYVLQPIYIITFFVRLKYLSMLCSILYSIL